MENVDSMFQNENINISSSAFRGSGLILFPVSVSVYIFLLCCLKHAARLFFSHFI